MNTPISDRAADARLTSGSGWRRSLLLLLAAGALLAGRTASAATATPALTEGPYYTFSSANQVV